jgi:hypothetical protein
LLASLIIVLIIAYFYPIIMPFRNLWYIIVIVFYSIMLYFKYALFGSDNVLWFAITLTFFAGYIFMFNWGIFDIKLTPIISLIPAISSLVLFVIYKNELHLNLLILLLITGLPGFLISYKILSFWWFVVVEIFANILALLLINLIHSKYKKG